MFLIRPPGPSSLSLSLAAGWPWLVGCRGLQTLHGGLGLHGLVEGGDQWGRDVTEKARHSFAQDALPYTFY